MPGFSSLSSGAKSPGYPGYTPRAPKMSPPGGYGGLSGMALTPVGRAARQSRYAMDVMGVPNFSDLLKQFGGTGEREFGRAGAAGAGADYARGQLEDWKGGLGSIRENIKSRQQGGAAEYEALRARLADRTRAGTGPNPFAGSLSAARAEYERPTESGAYGAIMGGARESTAAAASESARLSAEGAQRRGYAGGYDPRRDDLARMQALSQTGFDAVGAVRGQALDRYGKDVAGYGAAEGAATDRYKTDVSALLGEGGLLSDRYKTDIGALSSEYGTGMEGYKAGLGAFSDLTRTSAELPTKWLSALSGFGGALGGYGDIFRSALESDRAKSAREGQLRREQPRYQGPGRPGQIGPTRG